MAAGSHMLIKDDRFRIQNNELELTKIFPQDAGDFVCQISLSAGDTLEIAHTVEVLGMCTIFLVWIAHFSTSGYDSMRHN